MAPSEVKKTRKKIKITKEEEVTLPDAPKVKDGEMAMRMVYKNGHSHDIIGHDMCECIERAKQQAILDGMNFFAARESNKSIASWERVA